MNLISRCSTFACSAAALMYGSTASATLSDYQTAVTGEPSLISLYSFDPSNANDSRALHDGTLQGTTAFALGIGDAGQALQLDAVGRVNLGRVEDFDFIDGTGSIEAWVRAGWSGSLSYNACLFANRDGGPVTWSVHMNADRRAVGMWNGSAYQILGIPDAGASWHHLVVVFDTGNMTLYWDGAARGTVAHGLGSATTPTQLGSSDPDLTAEGWVGALDEVAFYADALSEASVQAHYAALFAGTPPVIVTPPEGGTFLPGVALQLTVGATGPSLSYQWYKGANLIPGETGATLAFASLSAADAASYHVVVSNPAASVPSADVTVALAGSLPIELGRYQTAVSNETTIISYYPFDRLSPTDHVGPYHGALNGTARFGPGLGGGAAKGLLLDGAGHVDLGIVSDFDFPDTTGTVEAWVRVDWSGSLAYDPCVFADRDGFPVTWSIHMNRDRRGLGNWNGNAYRALPIPDPSTNWHHFAVVFDTGTNRLYWDGLELGAFAQELGSLAASVQLGSSAAVASAEGWVGMLDEVAFYSDALSAAAIQAHFEAYFAGTPPEITVQPIGGAFLVGNALQLTVSASGADLSYQWYQNGSPIPGATGTTIGSASLSADDSGTYFVRVTNPAGSADSDTVTVQVGNNLPAYQAAVLAETNLISYYTFDAGDAADAEGVNPGSAVGTVNFIPGAGGVTNQALVLDGTGHINLGQVADFDFADGDGTVEAWIRVDWDTAGYDPCLFANRVASTFQVDWSVHMARTRNVIGNWNGQFFQTLGISLPAGWHHFAVTFGGDRVAMYWDGQPLGSFGQPIHLTTGLPTQIGSSDPGTTTEGWMGGIDEVALYRSTLGADAILNHYLAMVAATTAPPTLSASRSGNQLTLSWPTDVSGFTLESTEALPAASWNAVAGVVNSQVTVDLSAGQRFFRLTK